MGAGGGNRGGAPGGGASGRLRRSQIHSASTIAAARIITPPMSAGVLDAESATMMWPSLEKRDVIMAGATAVPPASFIVAIGRGDVAAPVRSVVRVEVPAAVASAGVQVI